MEEKETALKETILGGTITAFNQKGLKFTMDDLAAILGMSKKTIYSVFRDKEELFLAMVDHLFDRIKESEQAVLADEGLSTVEKIRKVMGALPDGYSQIDLQKLYVLREKYPAIYAQVEHRLETGWEATIALIEKGIEEGCIIPVKIPILKMMLEASVEQFFSRDILVPNGLSYSEGLSEVVSILMEGITNHN